MSAFGAYVQNGAGGELAHGKVLTSFTAVDTASRISEMSSTPTEVGFLGTSAKRMLYLPLDCKAATAK
jgi:hypothetical protein